MDRLAVSVSEGTLHEVAAPDEFETDGPFVVAVSNRGRDCHVHLRLDDTLSQVATLAETNPHVARDETVEIVIDVDAVTAPLAGLLTVETGYGADGTDVMVTVEPPAATREPGTDTERTTSDGGTTRSGADAATTATSTDTGTVDRRGSTEHTPSVAGVNLLTLSVALLAVGAVGVAVAAATLVADAVVVLGATAVVLAAGLAIGLLAR